MEEELNYLSEKIALIDEKIGLLEERKQSNGSLLLKKLKKQMCIYENILSAVTLYELNK